MACTIADRAQMYNNQSTCVRLSLNLVECLYQVRSWGGVCEGVGRGLPVRGALLVVLQT
jgi:hypothetical protein